MGSKMALTLAMGFMLLAGVVMGGRPAGQGRSLLQSSTDPPSGNTVLRQFRGVGTQNFTSGSDSQYQPAGAVADLYPANSTTQSGRHYFIDSTPYFEVFSPSTGEVIGSVRGTITTTQPAPSAPNDGGFGSIPDALLSANSGTGVWENVNFIQRANTLGGVVPSSLFTLPAFRGINNFLLAIPYQADYIFYVPA